MAAPVLSLRIDEEILARLDELSSATDRDRLYHVKRAITRYLDEESWHVQSIQEGLEDAKAGNLTDLDDVKSNWVNRAKNLIDRQSAE